MSAERKPQEDATSLFALPLRIGTGWLLRWPRPVVAVGVFLAVASVITTVLWLGFRTSRLDLLNPNSGYNQRWLAYLDEFGDKDDVLVVAEGDDRAAVIATIEDVAAELHRRPRSFEAIMHRRDLSSLKSKGLHYVPPSDLQRLESFLEQMTPVLQGDWGALSAGGFLRNIREQSQSAMRGGGAARPAPEQLAVARTQIEQTLSRFLPALSASLTDERNLPPMWPEMRQLENGFRHLEPEYLLENEGRLGFIVLHFPQAEQKLVNGADEIKELRRVLADVGQRHATIRLGLTGLSVMEFDEMNASQTDMTIASIVSLLGVIGLLMAGFGSWRHTALTVLTLVLGMAWSFGFVTLAVGHLNLLSVSFATILIGLGIDFGIHYIARYLQLRNEQLDADEAMVKTANEIGPGVITGAVTTAFAFFTAGLTEFTGVAELGVIAGAGIVICLLAALVVLPSMIVLADRGRVEAFVPRSLPMTGLLRPIFARPWLALVLMVAFTVAVTPGVFRLYYDHNLLNLQPRHLESVELERRMIEQSDRSVWFAVSMCATRAELEARKKRFEKMPSVERVEEISSLVPVEDAQGAARIAKIQRQLATLPIKPPTIPVTSPAQLVDELTLVEQIARSIGVAEPALLAHFSTLRKQLTALSKEEASRRLADSQQRNADELLSHLHLLHSLADPAPPTWQDVPPELVSRFVGHTGKQLLRVYARGDIWDMAGLQRFVADVESVDPLVTGHPVQTYYASHQLKRSFIHSAVYSLLALLIVLMLDFRNLGHSLLAVAPLALGVWQMFGVLGLLGIPFNAANMIVLPLILGIGIDNGVHVIHDWRCQRGRFRLSNSVVLAMVLCSSTTMVGFCSMMFAKHQGLKSLGQVLTLGIFLCLCTSLFFLPALLSVATRRRSSEQSGETVDDATSAQLFDEQPVEMPKHDEPVVNEMRPEEKRTDDPSVLPSPHSKHSAAADPTDPVSQSPSGSRGRGRAAWRDAV